MFGSRILRRRWVLAVIFGCSLTYFIFNTFLKGHPVATAEDSKPRAPLSPDAIKWLPKFDQFNASKIKTCRNSVQGQVLIADERGYVCKRSALLPGGCCSTQSPDTSHYVCDSCLNNGCCSVYEHCVSCCLQPEKQPLLRKILGKAADNFHHLFASVTDHFELCLAKCRTSSQSVAHENSYRDPSAKYCYGENLPYLQPASS